MTRFFLALVALSLLLAGCGSPDEVAKDSIAGSLKGLHRGSSPHGNTPAMARFDSLKASHGKGSVGPLTK